MSLSPMIVTRLLSPSFSLRITSRDASTSSSALSGWISSPSMVSASLTEETSLPPTRISVPVTTTITVSLGGFCDIDSGSWTARLGEMVSTPTLDIRKKIRIVKTSISDTRFMSTIDWLRLRRSLRFCRGVKGFMSALLPDDRRVADGDVREVVGRDQVAALHLMPGANGVHHLHDTVVRDLVLDEDAGIVVLRILQLQCLQQRGDALNVGPGRQVLERRSGQRSAMLVVDLDAVRPHDDLELERLVRIELLDLVVRLRRQAQVDHRQVREHRDRQQERHQHHDQVDERGDLEVSLRLLQAAGGHDVPPVRFRARAGLSRPC